MLTHSTADVRPNNFIQSSEAQNQIRLIAQDERIAETDVVQSFSGPPYKGTWVHPALAILAAQYLDKATFKNGQLGFYMAKALDKTAKVEKKTLHVQDDMCF